MSNKEDRTQLFDEWAAGYDNSVKPTGEFPFAGYEQVLETICALALIKPGMSILDLGTGTGNLAQRFSAHGCTVWGTDFSAAMLAQARVKSPQVHFMQADLLGEWPRELPKSFDRIVSSYVLHEFDLVIKIELLRNLAEQHLKTGGRIIIGDIAFPTAQIRRQANQRWQERWDEDEHYWAADEALTACREAGLQAQYSQVSSCGGVFVITLQE